MSNASDTNRQATGLGANFINLNKMFNVPNMDFNQLKENYTLFLEGFQSIGAEHGWVEEYDHWKKENQYNAIKRYIDPLNPVIAGDIYFKTNEPECVLLFETITLSIFYSHVMQKYEKETLERVYKEKLPERKIQLCEAYIDFVNLCKNDQRMALATVLLHELSVSHVFMRCDKRSNDTDTYLYFMSLMEIYKGYSVGSIYLQFTYWRITQEKKHLRRLTASLISYFQSYFTDFDKDPDLQLNYPMEGMTIVKKLTLIGHWVEVIKYHTEQLFEEYKKRKWLVPLDILTDGHLILPTFSSGELLKFKLLFEREENNTVIQIAVCNHRYAVWIKTTDVIQVYCEIIRMLYYCSEDRLRKSFTSKKEMLDLYDKVLRITDDYMGIIFAHKVYYKTQRQQFDSKAIGEQEEAAIRINRSIDDMLQITGSILDDSIEDLLLAKQRYLNRLEIFMTEDQEKQLDDYMDRVIAKLKENIKKLDAFNILYASITNEFSQYARALLKYPDIFSSLVSAEYLYNQYVLNSIPNTQFDYSCISIMYYMALEDFTNKLLYTMYATNVLDNNNFINQNNFKLYISDRKRFGNIDKKSFKKSCEIGNLGHLFYGLSHETEYEKYLRSQYPSIDIQRLIQFGKSLINIAPRRNDAAHGGNLISYQDVCVDKQEIYNTSVNQSRGLILELFSIVFPSP